MRIILLGAPGSGKGTQGQALADHFGIRHLSSGDVLREQIAAGTELGEKVARYVAAGELVPDDLIFQMMGGAVVEAARDGGYVLDGFPRSLSQAEQAYERAQPAGVTADAVVYLDVPDVIARERIVARAVGGRIDDSSSAVIENRLRVFHEQTQPLLDFYRDRGILVPIDATPPAGEVTTAMLDAVRRLGTG